MSAADGVFGGTHLPQNRDLDLARESRVGLDLLGDVAGRLAFGLTDTDDAVIELEAGKPVKSVFPDSSEDGVGTLLLPNTLAVVKGAPHPQAAIRLIDYLLSAEVEAKLAAGPSAQIPLNRRRDAGRLLFPGSKRRRAAAVEQQRGQALHYPQRVVQALDLAAAVVPARGATTGRGVAAEGAQDFRRRVLEQVGDRAVALFDAGGDVAGRVDVEEAAAGPAAGHAPVQGLIDAREEVRIAQEVAVSLTQREQVLADPAVTGHVSPVAGLAHTVGLHHEVGLPLGDHPVFFRGGTTPKSASASITFSGLSTPTRRARPRGVIGAEGCGVAWASRP